MSKPSLQDFKTYLEKRKTHLIQVYDANKRPINHAKFFCKDIEEKYEGEVYNVLMKIKEDNPSLNTVYIQKLRSLAGGYVDREQLIPYNLIDNRLEPQSSTPNPQPHNNFAASPAPATQQGGAFNGAPSSVVDNSTGLAGQMGLSMPQLMDMHASSKALPKIEFQLTEAQTRIKTLEQENKALDRTVLKYELGVEGQPGALDKILEQFAKNPELIGQMIMGIKGGGVNPSPAGLSQPITNSEQKNAFIAMITTDAFTEDVCNYAYHVSKGLIAGDIDLKKKLSIHFKEAKQNAQ